MVDVKEYCENMGTALSGWKKGINDIVDVVDTFPETDKKLLATQIGRLRSIAEDINSKIDELKSSCPVDFGPLVGELQRQVAELKKEVAAMWDLEHIAGGYVGG